MNNTIEKIATRKTYGQKLIELGEKDSRIVVVEADLMKASGSDPFQARFPERHFNVGIAEQDLIGVAGGLAAMGKIPFASSFACFAARRACDQVMISASYNNFNVKIVGSYSGLTSEKNGGTHISIADIAIFRMMPNFTVFVPGDCSELEASMEAAAKIEGPVYIRMARGPMVQIFNGSEFVVGKAKVISEGDDVTLITTGITTWEGILACQQLKNDGIKVHHLHMHTIKPVDKEAILKAAEKTKAIVTVENHLIAGGLGSLVTEVVCEECPVPVKRLGLDDCFGETAKLDYLMNKFGISSKHVVKAVKEMAGQKKKQ